MSVRITGPARVGMFKEAIVPMTGTDAIVKAMLQDGSDTGRMIFLAEAIGALAHIALKNADDETKAEFYNTVFSNCVSKRFKAEIV